MFLGRERSFILSAKFNACKMCFDEKTKNVLQLCNHNQLELDYYFHVYHARVLGLRYKCGKMFLSHVKKNIYKAQLRIGGSRGGRARRTSP